MLNARQMTWTGNVGVVEMSDLYGQDIKITEFHVKSPKTNEVKLFTYVRAVEEGVGEDKEIVAWIYRSGDLEIHILND